MTIKAKQVRNSKGCSKQRGVYSIEFALVGAVFFLLLFAVLEVGRLFFVWNILTEASRRGARLATVCHFDHGAKSAFDPMLEAALFDKLPMAPNLSINNLQVSYLQIDGTPVADVKDIILVRAEIKDYQHQLIIPGVFLTLNSPSFTTTLPRESLGVTRQPDYTFCFPTAVP
ncbi:MAG: pilus assembly protein TadE [Colwellia sp.]|nr:MAG: pilus assembly protein TadE [Colwellia sp.]